MCYKGIISLSFDVVPNGQIVTPKMVIFNIIIDSFYAEKWGTLDCTRRCVCKNLLNLDCQVGIRFSIFQVA